jgi:hypothetical protein
VDKFSWIKDLVAADQQMQDYGIVDLSISEDPSLQLEDATVDFLQDLKLEFLKVISAFNQLSGSSIGPIRVYSVAKTKADFMLFRYVKGAIFWNVKRKNYNKSNLNKIITSKYYKFMTVRNVNTVRGLVE